MKICVDCRLLDLEHNTGISRYTEFLLQYYIAKFGGQAIYIITNNRNLKYENCHIIVTPLRQYRIEDFVRYHTFVGQFKFDIYHAPFYSAFAEKLSGTKVIVTVHDLMFKIVPYFFSQNRLINLAKRQYFEYIVKKSLSTADLILSVSNTTRNDLLKIFNVPSIHIPEHVGKICTKDPSILALHELSHKGYFLYCGNGRPHKNLDFVINVFNGLTKTIPLVIAGRGHVSSNNVIAVGLVTDEQLAALYNSSLAFIFPSKYEGFGLPVLEALHHETPVIASRIPAFLEFKSSNITYFSLGDSEEFKSALDNSRNFTYCYEPEFFKPYSFGSIYDKLDLALNEL